ARSAAGTRRARSAVIVFRRPLSAARVVTGTLRGSTRGSRASLPTLRGQAATGRRGCVAGGKARGRAASGEQHRRSRGAAAARSERVRLRLAPRRGRRWPRAARAKLLVYI